MSRVELLLNNFLASYARNKNKYIDKQKYLTENTGNYVYDLIKAIEPWMITQGDFEITQEAINKNEPTIQLNRMLKIERKILEQEGNILNRSYDVNGIIFKFMDKDETSNMDDDNIIWIRNYKNISDIYDIIQKKEDDFKGGVSIEDIKKDIKKDNIGDKNIIDTIESIIFCGYIEKVIIYKNIKKNIYCIYIHDILNFEDTAKNILELLNALRIDEEWNNVFSKINVINIEIFGVNILGMKKESIAHDILEGFQKTVRENKYKFIKMIEFNYDEDSFYKEYKGIIGV